MKIARVVGVIGRVLIVAGVLLLFYTAYLLWGTSVYTHNAQKDLARQLHTQEQKPLPSAAPVTAPAEIPAFKAPADDAPGRPLFTIVIPRIALKTVVVEGHQNLTGPEMTEALKKGPAHFPNHPYPGEHGNIPISGHRTTFGAPFFNINQLQQGDPIFLESGQYRYRYTVTEQLVVSPEAVQVTDSQPGVDELTLTACHPRFSASQRLIIHARYEGPELIAAVAPGAAGAPQEDTVPASPPAIPRESLALAFVAAMSVLGAMGLSKHLRKPAVLGAISLVAGIGLWISVFPEILKLMPNNY